MPRKKLTVDEQAFVDYWTERMVHFKKIVRRADLYIRDVPRGIFMAAYKEVSNSGFVAGGEWGKRAKDDKSRWEPKQQDREAYVDHMRKVIEQHPLTSPTNAVYRIFAGNGGVMCIMRLIISEKPERVQDEFWEEVHKQNKKDLEDTRTQRHQSNTPNSPGPAIQRDPDEAPIDEPFIRARPAPQNPTTKISSQDWKQLEMIGETYFIKDEDDTTGFTAFELASIVQVNAGKCYKIRFEDSVDSIRVTEGELFAMIEDGIWV